MDDNKPESRGLLYILLSGFAVYFGWSLSKLRTPNHDSSSAQHPHENRADATQIGQNISSPVHVIVDASPPTPTPNKEREAREDRKERRDEKRFRVEIILAFVTSSLLIGNLLIVFNGRRANKIAFDALRQSQRPWVGRDIEKPLIEGAVKIEKDGTIFTDFKVPVKGFGGYGANNVFLFGELMVTQDITTIWDRERRVCDVTTQNADIGTTLFPGQVIYLYAPALALTSQAIRNPNANPPYDQFQAYLLTCIGYRDQFGKSGIPHHTGTIYQRSYPNGESVMIELKPATSIPGEWQAWSSFLD